MNFIPNAVSAKVMLTVLKTQKHSPKIMFAAGVVGFVATAVTASKATLKAPAILEEHREYLATFERAHNVNPTAYTSQDKAKDKALLIFKTSSSILKIYGPTILIGLGSIALLTGSHVVLTKRNAGLTAALAGVEKAFREYRDRVSDKVGVEQEREIYRDVRDEKVSVVDENGKIKQVVKKVSHGGGKYTALYGPITPEGFANPNWQELPEMNVMTLRGIQRQLNNRLQADGFLFLNEALKELDLPRTPMGQSVGWLKDSKDGDGFVDFGIFDDTSAARLFEFAIGREDEIWLDFNCQGNILDRI